MDFEKEVRKVLEKELKTTIQLETPPSPELGDLALPCFQFSEKFKKNPNQIAKDLEKKLKKKFIVKVIGGYLNFFIDHTKLAKDTIQQVMSKKKSFGKSSIGKGKKIVIDYSGPNIAKPFGIGHLRSTIIGKSLYNILSFLGYKCIRVNHLGDWGTQFGMLILAWKKWGNDKELKKDPIKYLYSLYSRINNEADDTVKEEAKNWFKKLEEGDKEAYKYWNNFKNISLKEFKKYYKQLDVDFDSYAGESFYKDMVKDVEKKFDKYLVDDQGALIIKLNDLPPVLVRKNDGASTYAARDLAAALYRLKKYNPEKILYVVGNPQNLHFKQISEALKLVNIKDKIVHIGFGHIRLKEGKMSTREGNLIFLEDVLDNAIQSAKEVIKEKNPDLKNRDKIAEKVGIGAVVFADLSVDRNREVVFDWKKILSFEGETGPYLQYTYSRCNALLKKAKGVKKITNLALTKNETELVKMISLFPKIVEKAGFEYKPSIIARYLLDLARMFNEFYQTTRIIDGEKSLKNFRLGLVYCVKQIIENGLDLLGIEIMEKM